MAARKRKRGRPIVLTPARKKEILAILTIGGSLHDAARYVGISRTVLEAGHLKRHHSAFYLQIQKAEASGKLHHLRKIHGADAWQASMTFLERKYPKEYARRPREDQVVIQPPPDEPRKPFKFVITEREPHDEPGDG